MHPPRSTRRGCDAARAGLTRSAIAAKRSRVAPAFAEGVHLRDDRIRVRQPPRNRESFGDPPVVRPGRHRRHPRRLGPDDRVRGNAIAGKRADFIGNPDLPHTYSYTPDIATGLATLGTDQRAVGGVWHLPGPETVTTRQLLELIAGDVGHPVGVRSVPKLAVRALGLFNPTIRELVELSYEFEQPFILDTTKYQSTFGTETTPLATALAATVAWYRSRNGSSDGARQSVPA